MLSQFCFCISTSSKGSVQKMAVTTTSHNALSFRLSGHLPECAVCAINGTGVGCISAAMQSAARRFVARNASHYLCRDTLQRMSCDP
jgi:hypothetical protein